MSSIGLAVSGGGARCFAMVGALKALEDEGLRVDAIAANSTSAVLAAIYAAKTDAARLEAIVRDVNFATFLEPDGSTGLIGHGRVEELLRTHAAERFEDLTIPLTVPAVDIETGEMLVFSRGPLVPPVCASNAFPGLFVPVEFLGRNLMDGGIVNNFPVDLIRSLTNRPVLAIDCRPPASGQLDIEGAADPSLLEKVGALFKRGVPTMVEILMRAYNITQDRVVEMTCALHPPDLRLTPELADDLDVQDFTRVEEAIEAGYRSVLEAVAAGRFSALDTVD